jgi:hypothetical protein
MGSRPGDAAHLVALRSASEALDGGDDEVHAVLPHLLWHVAVLPSTTCGISSVWAPASVKPWSRVGARTLISGYCICFRSISSEEGSASVMVAGLSGGRVGVRTIGWSRGRQRRALGWVRWAGSERTRRAQRNVNENPEPFSPNPKPQQVGAGRWPPHARARCRPSSRSTATGCAATLPRTAGRRTSFSQPFPFNLFNLVNAFLRSSRPFRPLQPSPPF